jgi:hypothetical protein
MKIKGAPMESRVKVLGVAVAAALCAAFAIGPGFAQEDAPAADRGAPPRVDGGSGDGAAIKGLPTHPGPDGSRRGMVGPEAPANGGIDPVRPEGGSAGLQRRANLKMLIANAPKMATGLPASSPRIGPPSMRSGADGAAARNAVGAAIAGSQLAGHRVSGPTIQTGAGTTGVGAAMGNVGGVNLHRPAVPLNPGLIPRAAGLNGTMMGHIGSGPGSIGGPAKDHSGINGTSIRPKR